MFLLLRQQADSGLAAISAATGGSSFYSGDSGSGSAISSALLSSCAVKQASDGEQRITVSKLQ